MVFIFGHKFGILTTSTLQSQYQNW